MPVRTDPKKYYNERCGGYAVGSDDRKNCEGYVDQCVSQFDAKDGDRRQSTYQLEAANGKKLTGLNFSGCLSMAPIYALIGPPKEGEAKPSAPEPRPDPKAVHKPCDKVPPPEQKKPSDSGRPTSERFSCDVLVMTPPYMDPFIDEDHSKMSCEYKKFEGKKLVTYKGVSVPNDDQCAAARRFDAEVDRIVEDYNQRNCKVLKEFIDRSDESLVSEKGVRCSLQVNAALFYSKDRGVCDLIRQSVNLGNERDEKAEAKLDEKRKYIEGNFKKD